MQTWTRRIRATSIHLGISLCIALLAAAMVFGLWYPFPYREISGGKNLFSWIVMVDVVLGPLITLIIFNINKSRRELLMDFTVIGVLQMAALIYGLWTIFAARPVHLVFEYTRMTVVHAIDIEQTQLQKAPKELRNLPLAGPTHIALRPFKDEAEKFDATMAAVGGASLSARPDLWQPYHLSRNDILLESRPAKGLYTLFQQKATLIDQAVTSTGKPVEHLRYLPLVDRDKVWTVLLDASTAEPLGYLPLDSF